MKKRVLQLVLVLFIFFISIPVISASRSNDSNKIENKTPFNYKGKTLYASVEVHFNINQSGYSNDAKIIKNVSARYDDASDVFYLSVKRSDINKLFTEKYDNVYSLLQANIDYHAPSKEGAYFMQLNHEATDCGYTLTSNESDYYFRNYGYLEVFSSTAPLSGTLKGEPSVGGGMAIVDSLNGLEQKGEYCVSDIQNLNPVIDLKKTKMSITIIEDEKIDLGENNNVISANSNFTNKDNEDNNLISENINNFYAEYDQKNNLKYSWTLFDENGDAIDINYDTKIELDNSSYEDEIVELFEYKKKDLNDKLKFISFKHEGKLGGTAKVSIYVGDKFKKGKKLNLFYYNKEKKKLDKMNLSSDDKDYYVVVDDDGYAAFDIDHCSEYVLAASELKVSETKDILKKNNSNKLNPYVIGSLVGIAIIITLLIIILLVKRKSKIKDIKK